MNRHYYISDNLDDLERLEGELEAGGIASEQIHVLSERDAELSRHRVHGVPSFLRRDLLLGSEAGMLIGLGLAVALLVVAYLAGWTQSAAGWMPFIFLALVLVGFSLWEGGLFGLQRPNHHFSRFADSLRQGKHLFFVDVEQAQEPLLERLVRGHPQLQMAGTGSAAPHWAVVGLQRLHGLRRLF